MKILHLINVHHWTGPAEYMLRNSEYLLKQGDNVLVGYRSYYRGVLKDELKKHNIPFTEKIKFPRGFKPRLFLSDALNIRGIIEEFKPDIVHCHNSLENIHCAILKNKKSKFKLVRTIYNSNALVRKPFSGFFLNRNDYIVPVCTDYFNKLIYLHNIPKNKLRIIRGFVNSEKFFPKEEKGNGNDFFFNNFNIKKEIVKIGMVARFQEKRGHKYLIEAFKKLIDSGCKDVKLILTGRGETVNNMKALCRRLNIWDSVVFTGYVKEQLPHLLQSLDIFVLLREGSDGTCRAILEGMSSGLPVVSVRRGAITDTVEEGVNGFLIESKENIEELYINLKKLVDNKKLREYMGRMSRSIIEKNFSMELQLKNYYDFYKEITEEDY